MRKFLVSPSGDVINTIIVGDGYSPPDGHAIVDEVPGVGIGWRYTNNSWAPPQSEPVTSDDVRAEAQRRIITLVGASDFNSCIVKQLNASMRATELTNKIATGGTLTQAELAEADILQSIANGIKAIRSSSNAMEANPPADYASNARWP